MTATARFVPVDLATPDNRKFRRLGLELEIDRAQALGHCVILWCRVGAFSLEGELGDRDAAEVEELAGWGGAPGALVSAMLDHKLLELEGDEYRIRGAKEHNGFLITKIENNRAGTVRKRKSREAQKAKAEPASGTPREASAEDSPGLGVKERKKERKKEDAGPRELYVAAWEFCNTRGGQGDPSSGLPPETCEALTTIWGSFGAFRRASLLERSGAFSEFAETIAAIRTAEGVKKIRGPQNGA